MKPARKYMIYKYSTMAGCFLLELPVGLSSYWGNLVIYVNSYSREKLGPGSDTNTIWVLPLYGVSWSLGLVLCGRLVQLVGDRWTRLVCVLVFNSALLLCNPAIQRSMLALAILLGGVSGLFSGCFWGVVLKAIVTWEKTHVGLLVALVEVGMACGSVIINQSITWHVNPDNKAPDLTQGRKKFFTQAQVLNKVPSVFLFLGGFSLACQILGFLLIRSPSPSEELKSSPASENMREKSQVLFKGNRCERRRESGTNLGNEQIIIRKLEEKERDINTVSTHGNEEYTPIQMLKTRAFYILMSVVCCSDLCVLLLGNFYKDFGQLSISDDDFLTKLGISTNIAQVIASVGSGIFIDRFSVKCSVIFFLSMMSLVSNWWYFTPMLGRWVYSIWTVLFGCLNKCLFQLLSVAMLKMFGSQNLIRNYGVATLSSMALQLVAPTFLTWTLHGYGWFYTFCPLSVACTTGVIASVLGLRDVEITSV